MVDTNFGGFTVPPLEYVAEDDVLVLGRGAGGINAYARAFLRRAENGNFGIGIASPAYALDIAGGIGCTGLSLRGASTVAWQKDIQWMDSAGALKWSLGADIMNNGGQTFYLWDNLAANIRLLIDATDARLRVNILPDSDNSFNLGWSASRWRDTYLVNSPTVTSDERQKLWIGIGEDRRSIWLRIARAIGAELGFYQWQDAVEARGEDRARWHFGARAQRVWSIVAAEGLCAPLIGEGADQRPDPDWDGPPPPAMLCYDAWDAETEERPILSPSILDEHGEPIQAGTETVMTREAGNRFGFRTDQLGLLLAWATHERLAALEAMPQAA